MEAIVIRRVISTTGEFMRFWESEGPFRFVLASREFPPVLLEPEEWLFANDLSAILKTLMGWEEKKMKIVAAPFSEKRKDPFRPEAIAKWRIDNFPEEWAGWDSGAFTLAGHLTSRVTAAAEGETPEGLAEAFFMELGDGIDEIGYALFETKKETFGDALTAYLKEWKEDEEDAGIE